MSEIALTFGWVERSNERANASLQPFDRALRSFAQQCLQGMEHQLYWVELRRILRQVAQFCATGLDRLLHAGDFVEGDVVDDQCRYPCALGADIVRGEPGKLFP